MLSLPCADAAAATNNSASAQSPRLPAARCELRAETATPTRVIEFITPLLLQSNGSDRGARLAALVNSNIENGRCRLSAELENELGAALAAKLRDQSSLRLRLHAHLVRPGVSDKDHKAARLAIRHPYRCGRNERGAVQLEWIRRIRLVVRPALDHHPLYSLV